MKPYKVRKVNNKYEVQWNDVRIVGKSPGKTIIKIMNIVKKVTVLQYRNKKI